MTINFLFSCDNSQFWMADNLQFDQKPEKIKKSCSLAARSKRQAKTGFELFYGITKACS